MQKPQLSEDSLSISEQLPPLTSTSQSNSGVFDSLGKTSLITQQLVIATIAGLISALVVVAVIQLLINRGGQLGITTLPQLIDIALAAFIAIVTVGAITFALELVIVNQINRGIGNLQHQCDQVLSGDFNTKPTVYTPKELGQIAISFNQMTQAINHRIQAAQKKADEQEKVKEELQQQLLQLLQGVEEDFYSNLALYPEEETIVDNEHTFAQPEGTLLEFLDRLLNVDRTTELINPQVFFGSSKVEEIQRHQDELQYREIWLQALLNETQKQLKFVNFMIQRADLKKEQVGSE